LHALGERAQRKVAQRDRALKPVLTCIWGGLKEALQVHDAWNAATPSSYRVYPSRPAWRQV